MSNQDYFENQETLEETEVKETEESEELDFSDNSEETTQAETDLDPEKIRREKIKKGKEKLQESDFKNDSGNWLEKGEKLFEFYTKKVDQEESDLREVFDDDDFVKTQMEGFLKSLVVGKAALFKNFLPGGSGGVTSERVSKPSVYIPELEKFRELVGKVNGAVKEWVKNSPEVKELINYAENELDPTNEDGSRATFDRPVRGKKGETTIEEVSTLTIQPYILGKNDWPYWICQTFEEQERPANK